MLLRAGSLILCALGSTNSAVAAVLVTGPSFTYSQDFNTLATPASNPTTAAWFNDATLPGWSLFTSASAAPPTYRAEIGNQDTGSFTAYGSLSASDKALGAVGYSGAYFGSPAVGAAAGYIAVEFTNASGTTLDSFTLGYSGEQWRWGSTTSQSMTMQYGFGSTFAGVSGWTTLGSSFGWTSPLTAGSPQGGVDGNGIGKVTGRGGTQPLLWNVGDTLWLRWTVTNTANTNQGMGIDDVSFAVTAVPEPASAFLLIAGLVGLTAARGRITR